MTRVRARAATAVALSSVLLLLAGPAGADHAFFGSARAIGFELTLAGEGLTIGLSEATIQSIDTEGGCEAGIKACASAVGATGPGLPGGATASSPGDEGPNDATGFAFPEDFSPLLTGALGVAQARADGAENPVAGGDAGAFNLSVTATQTLVDNIPIQDVLTEVTTQILDPLAANDPTGVIQRVADTVDFITDNLSVAPLVTLSGGPSSSTVESKEGVVTATATAFGTNIVIAPTTTSLPDMPDGLVIIEMGAGSVQVSSDQFDATANFDPALVSISFLDPGTGEYDTVAIAPGQSQCTPFEGTPLEPLSVCVSVGSGTTEIDGASANATAAGVAITAFSDPLPQLRIASAAAEASVNAAPPPDAPGAPPAAPPADDVPSMPRTGGAAVLPAVALLGLGYGFTRRRG